MYNIWFPHLSYESLPLIALFTQKYQNIIPGEVDKGTFTIHPHVPNVLLNIYLKNT